MKTSRIIFGKMFLFLLCSFCLCGILGCEHYDNIPEGKDPNPPFRYISADLKIYMDTLTGEDRDKREVVLTITDPAEVARLVKFFPGVGTKQESKFSNGGMPILDVILTRVEGGKKIAVEVDSMDTVWSEGNGDICVRGNLTDYLKNLVERNTTTANKVKH